MLGQGRRRSSRSLGASAGRCRANVAHIRQSMPDYGVDLEVLKTFKVVPGPGRGSRWSPTKVRFREKREHFKGFQQLLPESQSQNLAVTVLCVPYSLDRDAREETWQQSPSHKINSFISVRKSNSPQNCQLMVDYY